MVVDTVYTHGVQLQICSHGMKHGKEGITSMTNTVSEEVKTELNRASTPFIRSVEKYSKGPKVFPQKCFPVDFSAFTCLQENQF